MIPMTNTPIKITQISKDFDIKSKDVLDAFKELGVEKKSGGSADIDEFELFLNHITTKNQIKDLEAYREGRSKIKSAEEKKDEKPAVPADKIPPVEAKPQAPKMPAPEKKPQQESAAKPATDKKPAQQPDRKNQPQSNNRPESKDRRDNRDNRGGRDNRDNRGFDKYSVAPQENPFAKKAENMNRAAQGFRNPNSQWQKPEGRKDEQKKPVNQQVQNKQPERPTVPTPIGKVEVKQPAVLPAQKAALEKQQKMEAQKTAAPAKNSAVGWFDTQEALAVPSDVWMAEYVYRKLSEKVRMI